MIVPAVLPSSEKDFEEKLSLFASFPNISRVQIDVVDGRFASPASWPYTSLSAFDEKVARGEMLPALERIEYEIDLMCLDAPLAADAWTALGARRLTFHAGSILDLPTFLEEAVNRYGVKEGLTTLGLALTSGSDLAIIEPCLHAIGYVQFMGIAKIGRQGQPFDRRIFEKIRVFHERHPNVSIQVDGGVSLLNVEMLTKAGATTLIVGSGIVRSQNPARAFATFAERM